MGSADQNTHVSIRVAVSPADRLAALELIEEYRKSLPEHVQAAQRALSHASRAGRDPILLCTVDGTPAACCCLHHVNRRVVELKRFYTVPTFRGRSIGRQLLAAAITRARKERYETLRLGTLRSMIEAQRLYSRAGFVPVPPFVGADPVDELHFELALVQP